MKFNYPLTGYQISVELTSYELELLNELMTTGLKKSIRKREKAIQKIIDNPENEGQATYRSEIADIRFEIKDIEELVKELKP